MSDKDDIGAFLASNASGLSDTDIPENSVQLTEANYIAALAIAEKTLENIRLTLKADPSTITIKYSEPNKKGIEGARADQQLLQTVFKDEISMYLAFLKVAEKLAELSIAELKKAESWENANLVLVRNIITYGKPTSSAPIPSAAGADAQKHPELVKLTLNALVNTINEPEFVKYLSTDLQINTNILALYTGLAEHYPLESDESTQAQTLAQEFLNSIKESNPDIQISSVADLIMNTSPFFSEMMSFANLNYNDFINDGVTNTFNVIFNQLMYVWIILASMPGSEA